MKRRPELIVAAASLAGLAVLASAAPPALIDDSPYVITVYTRDHCPPCERLKRDFGSGALSRWAFILIRHSAGPSGDYPLNAYPRLQWRRKADATTWGVDGYSGPDALADTLAQSEVLPSRGQQP